MYISHFNDSPHPQLRNSPQVRKAARESLEDEAEDGTQPPSKKRKQGPKAKAKGKAKGKGKGQATKKHEEKDQDVPEGQDGEKNAGDCKDSKRNHKHTKDGKGHKQEKDATGEEQEKNATGEEQEKDATGEEQEKDATGHEAKVGKARKKAGDLAVLAELWKVEDPL